MATGERDKRERGFERATAPFPFCPMQVKDLPVAATIFNNGYGNQEEI